MADVSLNNPWIFTLLVVVGWVLLWVVLEVFFFEVSETGAALSGAFIGLVFGGLYLLAASDSRWSRRT